MVSPNHTLEITEHLMLLILEETLAISEFGLRTRSGDIYL